MGPEALEGSSEPPSQSRPQSIAQTRPLSSNISTPPRSPLKNTDVAQGSTASVEHHQPGLTPIASNVSVGTSAQPSRPGSVAANGELPPEGFSQPTEMLVSDGHPRSDAMW